MLAVAGILLVEAAGLGPWWTAPFRVNSLCHGMRCMRAQITQILLWHVIQI